jgi:hypothetical protein
MADNILPYHPDLQFKTTYLPFAELLAQPPYPLDPHAFEPRNFIPHGEPVAIPSPPPNGGLYGGPQSRGPWANIPVSTVPHQYVLNLESANPPPGAIEQMIAPPRLGNSTVYNPYVQFFVPPANEYNKGTNPYAFYVIKK